MNKALTINILAIETSSNACSAAVLTSQNNQIEIFEVFQDAPRQHNVLIIPMLDEVLEKANMQLSDMDALAFGRGPGAFTGVRVATSVIQAMAFGADIQVAPISSLAALAQGIYRLTKKTQLFVANDARMNEVYAGAFQLNNGFMQEVASEKVIAPELLEQEYGDFLSQSTNWSAVGSGWNAYNDVLQPFLEKQSLNQVKVELLPHAQDIAFLALNQVNNNQLYPASQVVPIYLRDNVAKKSVAKKSLVKKSI